MTRFYMCEACGIFRENAGICPDCQTDAFSQGISLEQASEAIEMLSDLVDKLHDDDFQDCDSCVGCEGVWESGEHGCVNYKRHPGLDISKKVLDV